MQPRGPGFWKFNNSLLEDEGYTSKLRQNLPLFREKYADLVDLGLKWDVIKMEIRGFTIKYSKIKAKQRKMKNLSYKTKLMICYKNLKKIQVTNNS